MKIIKFLSALACLMLFMSAAMTDDLLGKGRNKGGGGGGTTTGGTTGGTSGGTTGGNRGGGGTTGQAAPPVNNGGNRGGGGTTGQGAPPPVNNSGGRTGGGNTAPPTRGGGGNDDLLGRGRNQGGSTTGGTTGGTGRTPPQTGGQSGGSQSGGQVGSGRTSNTGAPIGNLGNVGRPDQVQPRSGRAEYGTVSNQTIQGRRTAPVQIGRAPVDILTGTMAGRVLREDNVRVNVNLGGLRIGYYQYDYWWRDDHFAYPHYMFTPVLGRCFISPWYYYPHLPAYLSPARIIVINVNPWSMRGHHYRWNRPTRYSGVYDHNELDWAINDLVQAFESRDERALGRIVPRRGRVDIFVDNHYSYTVNSDDFYDLLADAVYSTRTRRYEIVQVRQGYDESIIVARHHYNDPWGRAQSVYHTYQLVPERGQWVIAQFGTTTSRFGW
jgi:hypothetical protein